MLIKVPVDVIIESSLVCTLEIPVSVKQVNPTNKDEVDDQVMTCAAFRGEIEQAYNERRNIHANKDMPEFIPTADQVLTKQSVQYDDEDNVIHEIKTTFRSLGGYNRNPELHFKIKSKSDTDDVGKSIFDSFKLLAGSLNESSVFAALHVQPQDIKVLMLRPQTGLVNLLRNSVLQSDERLYSAVDKQHNNANGFGQPQSGVRAFSIRFRMTEIMRHTHSIVDLLPKKKKAKKTGAGDELDDTADNDDDEDADDDDDDDLLMDQPKTTFGVGGGGGGGFGSSFSFGGGKRRGSRHVGADMPPDTLAPLKELAAYLQRETAAEHAKWDAVFADGMATFDSLAYLLREGTKVVAKTREGHLQGGIVKIISYQQSMYGAFWSVTVETVSSDGRGFMPLQSTVSIPDFAPKMSEIAELPICPISDEQMTFLTQRGQVYRKLAIGAHHLSYIGALKVSAYRHVRADGRVMIDTATFIEHNPDGRGFGGRSGRSHGSTALDAFQQQQERQNAKARHQDGSVADCWDPLSDSLLFCTPPTLKCFSFRLHLWGDAYVVQLSEIQFREKAFSQLVLPHDQKQLIRAMVVNTRSQTEIDAMARKKWNSNRLVVTDEPKPADECVADDADDNNDFDDFVNEKGGGCIFLLSGPPGTGKTLTAEAVAEVLKLPLYCVTTGELGTTASELEDRLRYVLDLAATWNCCILLDEADVFLSQRGSDVVRSGLVSIFLRVIEYHQGVLFLTTNLPDNIDKAFASRINIALRYEPLGAPERAQVWRNFLESRIEKGEKFDTDSLSQYALNGRQIRSVFRVALAMARDQKIPLEQKIIETAIKHSMQL